MKMKSIINVTCIYVIFVSTRQRNEKKKIILALTVHSVRQRRRDCELIENLLLTYIFNKHAVLSNRTRERTLTSKKVQLPIIIIIILIEIWFDSSRNQGDETIFFAVAISIREIAIQINPNVLRYSHTVLLKKNKFQQNRR